jgi:hypothetical protein
LDSDQSAFVPLRQQKLIQLFDAPVFHGHAIRASYEDRLRRGELYIDGRLTRSGRGERYKAATATIDTNVHCAHMASHRWYGFVESRDMDDLF